MENKIGFFEESPGSYSMTRLMLFITVANAILLTDTIVVFGLLTEGTGKIGSLVGAAVALFTGMTSIMATIKLLQKGKENEGSNRELGKSPEESSGGTAE